MYKIKIFLKNLTIFVIPVWLPFAVVWTDYWLGRAGCCSNILNYIPNPFGDRVVYPLSGVILVAASLPIIRNDNIPWFVKIILCLIYYAIGSIALFFSGWAALLSIGQH